MTPKSYTDSWSEFWNQGHLTSLPDCFIRNYDGEFESFWNGQFASTPNAAKVLDLCTGNGSIALLAQTYSDSNHANFSITACDAANIKPHHVAKTDTALSERLAKIQFLGNTPIAQLGLPDQSFDLITSQFGVEYTDLAETASVIYTLLKPSGIFAAVCHSSDSVIVQQMAKQKVDYDFVTTLELLDPDLKRPNSRVAERKFFAKLESMLARVYARFVQDRSSIVLQALGTQLELIKTEAKHNLGSAFIRLRRLSNDLNISHATASDLCQASSRVNLSSNWQNLFTNAGLQLVSEGDIHYHTNELSGRFHVFAKST